MTLASNSSQFNYFVPHMSNKQSQSCPYLVREPLGKRSASHTDPDPDEPRAKRRFEKVNRILGEFSISQDSSRPCSVDSSSSDEDMLDTDEYENPDIIVEEPTEPSTSSDQTSKSNESIVLHPSLRNYLRTTERSHLIPMLKGQITGNELVLWRPTRPLPNPFDDPTMNGRIYEVTDDFETQGDDSNVAVASPTSSISSIDEEMSTDNASDYPRIAELSDSPPDDEQMDTCV